MRQRATASISKRNDTGRASRRCRASSTTANNCIVVVAAVICSLMSRKVAAWSVMRGTPPALANPSCGS